MFVYELSGCGFESSGSHLIQLIYLIGARPMEFLRYNVTKVFIIFHLMFLRIVICSINKIFEYTILLLLFSLLIFQKVLKISFIFDAG